MVGTETNYLDALAWLNVILQRCKRLETFIAALPPKNANLQDCGRIKAPLSPGLTGFAKTRKTSHRQFPEQMFTFYFGNTAIRLVQNTKRRSLATEWARFSIQTSLTQASVALGKDPALSLEPPSETSVVCAWHVHCCYISRRVGRPHKGWIPEVFSLALSCTGSIQVLLFSVQNEMQWRQLVLNGLSQ